MPPDLNKTIHDTLHLCHPSMRNTTTSAEPSHGTATKETVCVLCLFSMRTLQEKVARSNNIRVTLFCKTAFLSSSLVALARESHCSDVCSVATHVPLLHRLQLDIYCQGTCCVRGVLRCVHGVPCVRGVLLCDG